MTVLRWTRADRRSCDTGLVRDDLDGVSVLVLEDVDPTESSGLAWCRTAPCPVVATVAGTGGQVDDVPVDVVITTDAPADPTGDPAGRVEAVVAGAVANPGAARVLVDVLRVVPHLGVEGGLAVESLAYSMLLAGPEFSRWLDAQPARGVKQIARPPVRMERAHDRLHLTLDRPENRNAFGAAMRDALHAGLQVAGADDAIASVVIDAAGPVFSSGGDLTEFGTTTDVVRAHGIRTLRSVGAAIDRIADRVTVRVRGACVGAGVELPAFAGRVVAAPGTSFRLPEVAMGLIPGAGGTVSLTRRIGAMRTAELALSGRTMAVDEALALRLVDAVEPGIDAG